MRTYLSLFLAGSLLLLASACSTPAPAPAPAQPAAGAPEYRTTATIKDLMDATVDFNSDWLWDSVSTVISATGTTEKQPRTDAEWKEARNHAIALLEATNLLKMPGRAVAQPGEKSENPGIEEGPEEIKALMDADRESWVKYANGLYDATLPMLQAIDRKDAVALLDLGDALDKACESCHMHYWYPHQFDAQPGAVPAGAGTDPNHVFSDKKPASETPAKK